MILKILNWKSIAQFFHIKLWPKLFQYPLSIFFPILLTCILAYSIWKLWKSTLFLMSSNGPSLKTWVMENHLFTVIQTLFSKALTYLYKNTFSLEGASIFKFIHQACTHNPILYVMEEKVLGDFFQWHMVKVWSSHPCFENEVGKLVKSTKFHWK